MKTRILFLVVFAFVNNAIILAQVEVNNLKDLNQAVLVAKPGDVILLSKGDFSGDKTILLAKGTKENPISISAKKAGKVFMNSPLKIKGDFVSISGFVFVKNGMLEIEGKGCRVTNCTWDDSEQGKWLRVLPGSSEIEIGHNTFQNKITSNQNLSRDCQLLQIVVRNKNERHHVHHNLFKDVAKGKTGNGFETLQLITENNPFDPPAGACNTVVEDNLFIRCNGESEIISVKSNGNILRRNTFRACRGALVLRHGDNNVVTQNYLLGDGESGSAGVIMQGTGQVVANNYFKDLESYALGMRDGTPDDLYIRVERAQILFNTFINCNKNFEIGINHPKHPNGSVPKDCEISGNVFYSDKENKNGEFVVFVQNDQPENWVWKDNVAFGKKNPEMSGIQNINPGLELNENGLMVPTNKTQYSRFSRELNELLKSDLFGNKRKKKLTVGAVQFPTKLNKNIPLVEKMVGAEYQF